jgi:hypothetical protein
MLPPGCVEPHSEQLRCPTWWRVIAYLAATFARAIKSDKGTREKLETQDYSRAVRGIAERWRNARYSGGSAESSGWSRRRKRLFRACRDTPRSPAATP